MAFLQCAVSPDGKHVAVRRGAALTLHAAEGGAVLAEGVLVSEDSTLVFAGGAVVEHAIDAGRTVLTGFSFAKLARVSSCEIPIETALVADTGKFLLLAFGDSAHVVNVQPTVISYGEMRAAGKVRWAIGGEQDELLVSSARGLEMWDTTTRRPVRRIHLDLPEAPTAIGPATQRRTLWHTVAGGAEVRTVRLSDGKAGVIRLPAVPVAAIGHPGSSWMVLDLDGKPHALNLVTAELQALPTTSSASRALVPRGTAAMLVQLDAEGTLEWWELGATRVDGPRGLTLNLGAGPAAVDAKPTAPAARVALLPDVTLTLDGGPGDDEPPARGLHVARDVERVLVQLAARIRAAWLDRLIEDSHAGAAAPRAVLARHLVEEAQRAVRELGEHLVTIDTTGRVQPVRPIFADAPITAWSTLRVGRAGGHALDLAVTPTELGVIGRALGMLVAGADVEALARQEPAAKRTVDALVAAELVGPAAPAPVLAGQLDPGSMATLGGHTLLANLGGHHVLVDPRLPAASRADAVPAASASDLPPLAGIFLTSDDQACLDVATLLALDKRVAVHLPEGPSAGRTDALLRLLGFVDVRRVQPGHEVRFGDRGAVIALALTGAPGPQADRCGYALCAGDACALATGSLILDDEAVAGLAATGRALARRIGPVFVEVARRPFAPIERGWRWLLEPVKHWLDPRPHSPADLAPLAKLGDGNPVVIYGDQAVVPGAAGAAARRAEAYDRYLIGGDQDGWLAPR